MSREHVERASQVRVFIEQKWFSGTILETHRVAHEDSAGENDGNCGCRFQLRVERRQGGIKTVTGFKDLCLVPRASTDSLADAFVSSVRSLLKPEKHLQPLLEWVHDLCSADTNLRAKAALPTEIRDSVDPTTLDTALPVLGLVSEREGDHIIVCFNRFCRVSFSMAYDILCEKASRSRATGISSVVDSAAVVEQSHGETTCGVCGLGTSEEDNRIVFCDGPGCSVAVHQSCYGISKIPEGPWICTTCRHPDQTVTCTIWHPVTPKISCLNCAVPDSEFKPVCSHCVIIHSSYPGEADFHAGVGEGAAQICRH